MKHQVILDQIAELWKKSDRILLTGASNFDGDALGCVLALADFGTSQGKRMVIANEKPLPSQYGFLDAGHAIHTKLPDGEYDLIVICDTGSFEMLATLYSENRELFDRTPKVNIDHHHSQYGDVCWTTCGQEHASATIMIAKLIRHIDPAGITAKIATSLLLGLYYDTECFRNANASSCAYRFAAEMMEAGADHNFLIRSLYQNTDPRYVRLYGEVLSNIRTIASGAGILGEITPEMFARHGISPDSLGNELNNNYLRSVRAKFVVLVKDIGAERRLSFRSKDEAYDVREMAAIFGGGGHAMASGAVTDLNADGIVEKIEAYLAR